LNGDSPDAAGGVETLEEMAQRPKFSQERRQQILEAAAAVISERGLAETRVSDIAAAAGASSALIIYYLDSKDRLLTEALTYAEDRFYLDAFHELTEIDAAHQRLERLIEISFPEPNDLVDDWSLWIELWSRAGRDPEAARKRAALDHRWRMTIADVVRAGQQNGDFAEVDPDDFATQLAAMLDGLAIQVVLDDKEVGWSRARSLALEFARERLNLKPQTATTG
jgi:AcrR family transcriptional regulator